MMPWRRWLPVGGLALSFIIALMLVQSSQMLFGGYEGLLYHGLKPVIEGEALTVAGEMRLRPRSADMLTMTFRLEGIFHRDEGATDIHIELVPPGGGTPHPIGTIFQKDNQLFLRTKEADPVLLATFPAATEAPPAPEVLWQEFYALLTVSETMASRVEGARTVTREVVQYKLPLSKLFQEENMPENLLNQDLWATDKTHITLQIDKSGTLSAIKIGSEQKDFALEGWISLGKHSLHRHESVFP